MKRATWKAGERRVARDWHTERTPLSGGASRHTRSDTLHEHLFIETKHRPRHATRTLYDKTEEQAKEEGKIPVLCLIDLNRKGYLICFHRRDARALAPYLATLGEEE